MKKGLLSLLGLVAIAAIVFMPAPPQATHAANANSASMASGNPQINVTYHGGPVMAGMAHIYAIFWEPTGNIDPFYNALIQQFFGDMGNSPFYQLTRQYTQTGGGYPSGSVLAGGWVDNTTAYGTTSLQDSDIQREVTHAQQVNGWTSSINNAFFVFTERNTTVCTPGSAQCASHCGYHSSFDTNTIYAAVPYGANDCHAFIQSPNNDVAADTAIFLTLSFEMEMATNPLGNAWYYWSAPGTETGGIALFCQNQINPQNSQGADVVWNGHQYVLPGVWDNSKSSCVLPNGSSFPTFYKIVNRLSGLTLDVSGSSTNLGAQAVQSADGTNASQEWAMVPDGAGLYQIINRYTGLALDVSGRSTSAGAPIIQWTNHNGFNQQWLLQPAGDGGYMTISNDNSGLYLDVNGASTAAGAQVVQQKFAPTGTNWDKWWEFVPVPVKYYKIQNVNSNLVMDVAHASINAGDHVLQWPYHDGPNQEWDLIPDGSYYQIMNYNSGLVLDVYRAGTNAGAQVIQWNNHNGKNQQWQLLPSPSACLSGAVCQIQNVNSGLVLDVFEGGTNPGVNVIQWSNHNGKNQQWLLVPVS